MKPGKGKRINVVKDKEPKPFSIKSVAFRTPVRFLRMCKREELDPEDLRKMNRIHRIYKELDRKTNEMMNLRSQAWLLILKYGIEL